MAGEPRTSAGAGRSYTLASMPVNRLTRRCLLVAATVPVVAAACGQGENLDDLPKIGLSEGKVVYATWGAPERRELEDWSLLTFEKNYDLRVDVVWAQTIPEYIQKQHALLAGGTPPDVLRLPSWTAPTFYYEDAVRRLDPYFRRDGYKTDHLAAPFDVATYKRSWYALPRGQAGTWVLFYNRRLFDEAGLKPPASSWTWDDFLAAARALTRPGAGGQRWGVDLDSLASFFYPWLWGHGADYLDKSGEQSALDQPATREALRWLADLRLVHRVAPPPGELPPGAAGFATGRLGMWYAPADAELELAKLNPPDYGLAYQPKGKAGQQAGYKPDVVALSALSQHSDDGWELLQFLVDVDTQRAEFEHGLWLPQAKAIVDAESYQKPDGPPHDRRPGIPGTVLRARTPTLLPRADDMRAVTQKELAPFWTGARSVEEATAAAAKAVNAILNGEA